MKKQSRRPTSSHESREPGEDSKQLLAFPEEENLTARSTEQHEEETEMDDAYDDDDEELALAGGRAARPSSSLSCGLGDKKRRLALDQVRALERSFEVDNKLDPDRKARIARDLGLQPRQVAVWFQNRRARWKTKQLERDFAALRARHDALRADCDALRHDKDALAAEIRELRQKLSKPETSAVKVEAAGNVNVDAAEAPAGASANKDGSSDSDSSVVFNDVEASPYSGAVFVEQPAAGFVGFGGSFMDSSAAASMMGCSSLASSFGAAKWQHHGSTTAYPCDPYKGGGGGGYGFTEEWLAAGSDVISCEGAAGFFSDEHAASSLNFSWCASGAEGWD